MSDIVAVKSVAIQTLLDKLSTRKHNPSTIQQTIFEHLDEITGGEVNVVDPTNPFVFLLESSAVNTALAINENIINLRKQYPSLAQTEEDVYMHMSDRDYLNRFSTPAETVFNIVVNLDDILNRMVYNTADRAFKATIARDTFFTIEDYVFTLQYPIDIRKYDNGIITVSYDAEIVSPIDVLQTNIIEYTARKALNDDGSELKQLFIPIKVKQFKIDSTNFTLQQSTYFSQRIQFTDRFFFVRGHEPLLCKEIK